MKTSPELLGTSDARVWAAHFLELNPNCGVPEDVTVGWFANSIMCGHDLGQRLAATKPRDYSILDRIQLCCSFIVTFYFISKMLGY